MARTDNRAWHSQSLCNVETLNGEQIDDDKALRRLFNKSFPVSSLCAFSTLVARSAAERIFKKVDALRSVLMFAYDACAPPGRN
jgi:hypothetical protein